VNIMDMVVRFKGENTTQTFKDIKRISLDAENNLVSFEYMSDGRTRKIEICLHNLLYFDRDMPQY
jgi:hypothetical protein